MSTVSSNRSSGNTSFDLADAIVGGHLLGFGEQVQLVVDFEIFNPQTKFSVIEKIIIQPDAESYEVKYYVIDKTGNDVFSLYYETKDEAVRAMEADSRTEKTNR
jgi:hypothetical protein